MDRMIPGVPSMFFLRLQYTLGKLTFAVLSLFIFYSA